MPVYVMMLPIASGQDQNKRFDPTYSFGLSWNVAQEPWLNSISNILNQFNIECPMVFREMR